MTTERGLVCLLGTLTALEHSSEPGVAAAARAGIDRAVREAPELEELVRAARAFARHQAETAAADPTTDPVGAFTSGMAEGARRGERALRGISDLLSWAGDLSHPNRGEPRRR